MTSEIVTKEHVFIQLHQLLSDGKLFHGHGVIDAEDEAMMIMMTVFHQSVEEILSSGSSPVAVLERKKAIEFAQQRIATCQPMAYVLGVVNFAGLAFIIDNRALVPRSPIAELILNKFKNIIEIEKVDTALDLCTGSGCIGISVAKYFQEIQCDIADISSEALSLATDNIKKQNVKISVIKSDLFQNVVKSYDLIISNPPYVSNDEYNELPFEYKCEPKLGLVAEQDGLKIPVQIMQDAPRYLTESGTLILEVGYSDELLDSVFPQIPFQWIEFSNGGQGVCVFTRKILLEYQHYFKEFLESD